MKDKSIESINEEDRKQLERSKKIDAADRVEVKRKVEDLWRKIGSRIMEERNTRHLTQKNCVDLFNDMLSINKSKWSRIESGERQTSEIFLYALGIKFGLSLDVLFYGRNPHVDELRELQTIKKYLEMQIEELNKKIKQLIEEHKPD